MRFIAQGTRMVLGTPRLWRYIVQPLLVGIVAFIAVWALAYWLIVPRLTASIQGWSGAQSGTFFGGLVALLTSGLFILLLVITAGFLYLTLVSFFSSMLWEKLSLEVELIATGRRVETKLPTGIVLSDSLSRTMMAVMIAILSLCCGWTFFGIPALLLAGYLGLHDYTAAAYLRRGLTLRDQRGRVTKLPGWFSFLLGSGLLTLIPILNVLMLPCLVAGGTLMVAAVDRPNATFSSPPARP